ncbi:MAG: hypothetical protein CFH06_01843 [Alphaproteobacteria bacterium MarineAlpha3_Bin5]|nr:hypothetical protein [Magnetovibrio sp.]PPR75984.1 MAG: hypothetical protein CFH06_01843 [Alphaproteobacteria bacterium MarineAlpha3_Bin5]
MGRRMATINLALSVFLFGFLKANAAEKSKTVSEMLSLYAAGTEQYRLVNTLIVGATGRALSWANSKLRVEGRNPLYCRPDKLIMNNEQYLLMLKNAVKKNPTLGTYPVNALGMIVLDILIDTFPCSKG